MPKSTKKNPYILFCLEKKQIDPNLQGKGLRELVELCNQEWSEMGKIADKTNIIQVTICIDNENNLFKNLFEGPDERRPYYESADQLSRGQIEPNFASKNSIETTPSDDLTGKFDAFGRSFFAIKKNKMQEQGLYTFMKEDISRQVKVCN